MDKRSKRYGTYNDGFYHSKEWKHIRQLALVRDSFLCQECLKQGKITPAQTVHHIKQLRTDKKDALKLENLEVVCPKCHNQLHREKGRTLVQKRQAIKYKQDSSVLVFDSNKDIF